ncbi:MAG: SIS domain-containing protein [Acidobacteria bacterium]|nr:SIS domain-containing protein [Acidobacteriota bacterium]
MNETGALAGLLVLPEEEKLRRGLRHTPHEIHQQPATWENTYHRIAQAQNALRAFLTQAAPDAVFLNGAGTSDYVGKALAALLRQHWRCEVQAIASTDLLTEMDELVLPQRSYLWVSFSRSGDSPEGVAVMEAALRRFPHIHHLVISCNQQGRLVREFAGRQNVFCVTLDDAVNDRGLAMTSSFTNLVIAGQCLAHVYALADYEATLQQLIAAGQAALNPAAKLAAQLARTNFRQACFLGSGSLNAIAHEAALKLLELTAGRVSTRSESFLGIRHGPLSAVNAETLVVAFLSSAPQRQSYELDLLAELQRKKLGQKRIVVTTQTEPALAALADEILLLQPALPDAYRPPVDVLFGQLLGLFASLQHSLQPDTPSPNGAISRVVNEFKIYA